MMILDLFNLNLWEALDFKLTGISSNEEYEECEEEFERSFKYEYKSLNKN